MCSLPFLLLSFIFPSNYLFSPFISFWLVVCFPYYLTLLSKFIFFRSFFFFPIDVCLLSYFALNIYFLLCPSHLFTPIDTIRKTLEQKIHNDRSHKDKFHHLQKCWQILHRISKKDRNLDNKHQNFDSSVVDAYSFSQFHLLLSFFLDCFIFITFNFYQSLFVPVDFLHDQTHNQKHNNQPQYQIEQMIPFDFIT